jgi:hypothetical protein|tara:strand:- start:5891 stop:6337 length:447 start_codon:yes stop_codon:yes gene_type:complete
MNITYLKRFIITVLIPIIFGSLIYIVFRKNNIIFIEWLHNKILYQTDLSISLVKYIELHEIIIYSLPDGLWTFSLINLVLIIWNYKINRYSFLWIIVAILLSIVFELVQLTSYVKGTFDYIDLLFIIIAIFLSFIINKKQIKINNNEN